MRGTKRKSPDSATQKSKGVKRKSPDTESDPKLEDFLKRPYKNQGKWAQREPENSVDEIQLVLPSSGSDQLGLLHNWLNQPTPMGPAVPVPVPDPHFGGTCNPELFEVTREDRLQRELQNATMYLDHRSGRVNGIISYLKRKLDIFTKKNRIMQAELAKKMEGERVAQETWDYRESCGNMKDLVTQIEKALEYLTASQNTFASEVLMHLHSKNISLDISDETPTKVTDSDLEERFSDFHKMLAEDNETLLKQPEMGVFRSLLVKDQAAMAERRMRDHPQVAQKKRRGKLRKGMKGVQRDTTLMIWDKAPPAWNAKKRVQSTPTGWVCPNTTCRAKAWILSKKDGSLVCKKCGIEVASRMSEGELNYKQRVSTFKHLAHFQKRMTEMEGSESPDLVPEVYCALVKAEARSRKIDITSPKSLTQARILRYLTINRATMEYPDPDDPAQMVPLKTPTMYEHVNHIQFRITGVRPPQLTTNQRFQLCQMFVECLPNFFLMGRVILGRKNLIRYPDILYHLLELNRWNQFLPYIRKVGWECQKNQERIWKMVCEGCAYPYIERGLKD